MICTLQTQFKEFAVWPGAGLHKGLEAQTRLAGVYACMTAGDRDGGACMR